MEAIVGRYVTALDELNLLMTVSYYTAGGDNAARVRQITDDLLSLLVSAYTLGTQDASEMLDTKLAVNLDGMEDAIFAVTGGKTFEDRVADHVQSNSPGRLRTLAESEFHRVYNRAINDGAQEYVRRGNPGVMKTWCTVRDGKVRDTHDYLEGMSVPAGEDFYSFDGDHAACPGGFEKVENNAGCRCVIRLSRNVL